MGRRLTNRPNFSIFEIMLRQGDDALYCVNLRGCFFYKVTPMKSILCYAQRRVG
jgi:hypothetical protein